MKININSAPCNITFYLKSFENSLPFNSEEISSEQTYLSKKEIEEQHKPTLNTLNIKIQINLRHQILKEIKVNFAYIGFLRKFNVPMYLLLTNSILENIFISMSKVFSIDVKLTCT
jgi:hypothetical protein